MINAMGDGKTVTVDMNERLKKTVGGTTFKIISGQASIEA